MATSTARAKGGLKVDDEEQEEDEEEEEETGHSEKGDQETKEAIDDSRGERRDDTMEPSFPEHCSFAVTGPVATFQSIFVCRDCSEYQNFACICQACANVCHEDHAEIDYIGMGPAYCDCNRLGGGGGCRLTKASRKEAKRMGISSGINHVPPVTNDPDKQYVQDVYIIPVLAESPAVCELLLMQALELVNHTRETHWVDVKKRMDSLCELERLAFRVFQQHSAGYGLNVPSCAGAEWWVQVKSSTCFLNDDSNDDILESCAGGGNEAVDLHYDKDETLAEHFGLGSFPTLSTVTYLTDSSHAAPTVVFPHMYTEPEDDVMQEMLVSHPRRGKHLVFDGRLLHGAPAHHALRPLRQQQNSNAESALNAAKEQLRVTFLVNLWMDRKPTGVKWLPKKIRHAVNGVGEQKKQRGRRNRSKSPYEFQSLNIETLSVSDEDSLPSQLRGRIELPFVGKGTTWETADDDDEAGLMLVTFPPPEHEGDTALVRFGPGLQAYLDRKQFERVERACADDLEHYSQFYV